MSDDLQRYRPEYPGFMMPDPDGVWVDRREVADRIEDLEAKLEKAVVALDKIKRIDNLVGVFAACERTLAEITEEQSHE